MEAIKLVVAYFVCVCMGVGGGGGFSAVLLLWILLFSKPKCKNPRTCDESTEPPVDCLGTGQCRS